MMKFWRSLFIVFGVAAWDYRKASSLKRRKGNCSWKLGRDERKNRQELVQTGVWRDLCVITKVIGICHMSYQPDECGTRPFSGGFGRRAAAQTHPEEPKMSMAPVDKSNPSKKSQSLGDAPPPWLLDAGQDEPWPTATGTKTHQPDPRTDKTWPTGICPSTALHRELCIRSILLGGYQYLSSVPSTRWVWHKDFLGGFCAGL